MNPYDVKKIQEQEHRASKSRTRDPRPVEQIFLVSRGSLHPQSGPNALGQDKGETGKLQLTFQRFRRSCPISLHKQRTNLAGFGQGDRDGMDD